MKLIQIHENVSGVEIYFLSDMLSFPYFLFNTFFFGDFFFEGFFLASFFFGSFFGTFFELFFFESFFESFLAVKQHICGFDFKIQKMLAFWKSISAELGRKNFSKINFRPGICGYWMKKRSQFFKYALFILRKCLQIPQMTSYGV